MNKQVFIIWIVLVFFFVDGFFAGRAYQEARGGHMTCIITSRPVLRGSAETTGGWRVK